MSHFIDRTGEVHGHLQITKELGKGKVMCICLKCNSGIEKEYGKANIIAGKTKY